MNQVILEKLDAIAASYDQRAAELATSIDNEAAAHERLWPEFTRLRDEVIIPAAEEVAVHINKLGHFASVRSYDPPPQGGEHRERAETRFIVHPTGGEPSVMALTYSRESANRTVRTMIETPSRLHVGASLLFDEITKEVVEVALVDFVSEAFHPHIKPHQ